MNSIPATSLPPVIEPLRMYSAQEVRLLLGKTLAARVTTLAVCKGRYLGETLLAYMREITNAKLAKLLEGAIEESTGNLCTKFSTDPIGQKYNRKRKRENGLTKDRARRVRINRAEQA